jgi:hypothetical protein
MTIHRLHLDGIAGLAPKFLYDRLPFHAQVFNHPFLVVCIK